MRRNWQVAELGLVNKKTGELYDAEIRIAKKKGGKFMKIWQDTGWEKRLGELHGNSLKVLFHLTMVCKWENLIDGPSETARVMEWKKSLVVRAYGELIKSNFVVKQNGGYRLSPFFCWKGNDEQYENACRELTFTPRERLLNLTSSAVKGLI